MHQCEAGRGVWNEQVHQGHQWPSALGRGQRQGQGQGSRGIGGVGDQGKVGLQGDGLAEGRPYPGVVVGYQQPDGLASPGAKLARAGQGRPIGSGGRTSAGAGNREQVTCSAWCWSPSGGIGPMTALA